MGENDLIDITHTIVPEEEPNFFKEDEALELYESCIHIMEYFITANPKIITEPDFDEIFDENINELMDSHFDEDIFYNEEAEKEMNEIIDCAKNDFFKYFIPPRSHTSSLILKEPDHKYIQTQIDILRNKPQPVQRTKEWYIFRHNLITASNAYKAFENQSTKNQLIYEKCQPLNADLYIDNETQIDNDIKNIQMVNTNSTLHWGQKYEPLSVKYYEYTYNTKVEDFGCIQHDTYSYVGASPDGINIDPDSQRYGRMLEIKNIVNRVIDGIPKKEYWIQMQLQMEVCGLDECDFLETKFLEYTDRQAYEEDTTEDVFEDEDGVEFLNTCVSKDNKMKGQIIYFHTKEAKPFYLYKPLDLVYPSDIQDWHEKMVDYYQTPQFNYVYMKTIFWKLDYVSCVLVLRNRQWFKDNIHELEEVWSIIEKERISGFEHRAPNRKTKPENAFEIMTKPTGGCLLHFNKDTGRITVVKKQDEPIIPFELDLDLDLDLDIDT